MFTSDPLSRMIVLRCWSSVSRVVAHITEVGCCLGVELNKAFAVDCFAAWSFLLRRRLFCVDRRLGGRRSINVDIVGCWIGVFGRVVTFFVASL